MSRSAIGAWKIVALLAVVLLAAFFRLHRIDTLPPGDRYDPAFYGVDALRVLAGERPVFFCDYAGEHPVEPLRTALGAGRQRALPFLLSDVVLGSRRDPG